MWVVKMTDLYIQAYPQDCHLKTGERKALYQQLLENDHCFGERGKGFTRALKTLVFEGKIESYEQVIKDEESLWGSRENDLGYMLPAYICLASPVVSEEFFIEILSRYPRDIAISIASDVAVYLDGGSMFDGDMFSRIKCLMHALDHMPGVDFPLVGIGRSNLARMFNGFLSGVCYKGAGEKYLFPFYMYRFNENFNNIISDFNGRLADISELLECLLGSRPKTIAAYADIEFINFCQLYFSRSLGPEFLAYLDSIYQSIPENRRIRLDGNKILYFAE